MDCGTIHGLRSRDGTDNRKIQCATRLGVLDVPGSSAHKAEEFVSFRTLFSHLFVRGNVA